MAVEETSGARPVAADQPPTPQAAPEAAPEAAPAVQSKIEVLPAVRPATELITQIRSQIQLKDRAGMTQFGERAHKRVTEFSDRILSQTRNKDIGETGRLLSDIIMKAKGPQSRTRASSRASSATSKPRSASLSRGLRAWPPRSTQSP
jgi:uncharacterized protein YaaN involved in tellurite resistance